MSENYAGNLQMQAIMQDLSLKMDSLMGFTSATKLKCLSPISRWLRFDLSNRRGLVLKENTSILKSNGDYFFTSQDLHIDFTSDNLQAGKDYFVNLSDDDQITCATEKLSTGVTIGRFHTLCVDAGTMTMIAPAEPSSGIVAGDSYLVKPYDPVDDPDFYQLYNMTVSANATNATHYDTITMTHPLSGFVAGDILPESVFCLTFQPMASVDDAMVYDKTTGIAVDVYLQSGTGVNTRSAYNQTHTTNRRVQNHLDDFKWVGKTFLNDFQFSSVALGSNSGTNIVGASDKTTVGGHTDTAGRRMISAIGCEECCGYVSQWLADLGPVGGSSWDITDGVGKFGKCYGSPFVLRAGGDFSTAAANVGFRARLCNFGFGTTNVNSGARGCSQMKIC